MRLSIAALLIVGANAFTPGFTSRKASTRLNGMAEDVGIPCEGECALESFPNLPASVHPGVLSGQAMMDLLDHAKKNGELVSLQAVLLDIHATLLVAFHRI
jgi:fructose-bisphosphate aldolase class II